MKKLSDILKGKTCAVVSNSGDLMNYEYGELIDSHDVVIRCNWSLINGYEKHVGTKTDIRLINIHLVRLIINFEKVSKDSNYNRVFPCWSSLNIDKTINDELIILHPTANGFLKSVSLKLKNNEVYSSSKFNINNHSYSTGMISILLASKLFESVSCFCFDFFQKEQKHYFENSIHNLKSHNISGEYEVSRNLLNTKFYPS
jgi:hypothetical protein